LNLADTNVTAGTSPASHASSYACSIFVTPSSSSDKRIPSTMLTSAAAVRIVVASWTYYSAQTIAISFLYFLSIAETEKQFYLILIMYYKVLLCSPKITLMMFFLI